MSIDGPNSMVTTRSGIEYDMQRSPGSDSNSYYRETWRPDVVNSSFVAKVEWDDVDRFVLDMIGEHQQSRPWISRFNPQVHPFNANLYCVGCESVRNLGRLDYEPGNGNAVRYEQAEYLCTFASFLYDIYDDFEMDRNPELEGELKRYVQRTGRITGQSIQTSVNGVFKFATAPQNPVPTPPAIHVPYEELTYTWHYVPGPIENLKATAREFYGKVNATLFDYGAFAPGTLLYMGMEYDRVPSTPSGNELWMIKHHLNYFHKTWNVAYRPNVVGTQGDWDGIVMSSISTPPNGDPPYAPREFRQLFFL